MVPPSGAGSNTVTITPVGPNPGSQSRFETTQDIEAALTMAPGVSGVYVVGGNTPAGVFNAMATTNPLAYQLSMSYLEDVDLNAQAALAVLAARGQSLFVASGDWGGASPDANDIRVVDFVTVVGGTTLQMNSPGVSYETENGWPSSGGGFTGASPTNPGIGPVQPVYQNGMSWAQNGGSSTTRNFPGVAMPAENAAIYTGNGNPSFPNGYWSEGSGTSLSTPPFAGYMALVNQSNASKVTQPSTTPNTVGFANPLLYYVAQSSAYGTAFNDIADGTTNPSIAGLPPQYLTAGGSPLTFTAGTGYDLVTGWGSPTCQLTGLVSEVMKAQKGMFGTTTTLVSQAYLQSQGAGVITNTISDGTNVYFGVLESGGTGAIWTVPVNGGNAALYAPNTQANVLASDGVNLYWVSNASGNVYQYPLLN